MLCKYYLQIGDNTVDIKSPNCIEVTKMMADSANFVTAYTRPYYNGVIRKSNSKLLLIGEARRLLIEEYRKNYLNSKAAFSVYCIDNRWEYHKASSVSIRERRKSVYPTTTLIPYADVRIATSQRGN